MSRPGSSDGGVPGPNEAQAHRGYGAQDFAQDNPSASSPLSQSMSRPQSTAGFHDDATQHDLPVADDGSAGADRAASTASTAVPASAPSRSNTLKKRSSMRRTGSLKRSSSKRSLKAGSVAGIGNADRNREYYSYSTTPIPTSGTPTEVLANRFQAWRQLLKSLISYFREIQTSYEQRAKATHKVQGAISNISHPAIFMSHDGLAEATRLLDEYHKHSIAEANKSRDIEADVINALTGLRSDLGQKIKEIKSLSGDFKNSVEKQKDGTRREVEKLQDALQHADHEDGGAVGKNDPFVVKLGVDRAVESQVDEENYLHRAYLNLESSGRELESIVVGEIQKAYNALAGILKREADDAYHTVDGLRTGPIAMPKDAEWLSFVQHDPHFVDPKVPLRRVEEIEYPGKHHPAASEIRAGMLERKSKYLKSYTPGWYVLSPTHLHEFKSADKIYSQPPVMSLYLPDQRLGSQSQPGSSSHKFMVKGKQSGNMHKGHNWVFRAESYDTMMAWFEDMRILTEKSGEERNAFVRKHARSVSGTSDSKTVSSDGMEEDEADEVPYSADVSSLAGNRLEEPRPQRPQPGGRFPSDLQVPRERGASFDRSSTSTDPDQSAVAVADGAALAGGAAFAGGSSDSPHSEYQRNGQDPYRLSGVNTGTRAMSNYSVKSGVAGPYGQEDATPDQAKGPPRQQQQQPFFASEPANPSDSSAEHESVYGDWMAPAAAGVAGAGVGAAGVEAYRHHQQDAQVPQTDEVRPEVPEKSTQRSTPPGADNVVAYSANQSAVQPETYQPSRSEPVDASAAGPSTANAPFTLGGLESEGAHETGAIFPKVIRHDTEMSISQLHVPGEFPKRV